MPSGSVTFNATSRPKRRDSDPVDQRIDAAAPKLKYLKKPSNARLLQTETTSATRALPRDGVRRDATARSPPAAGG